VGLASFGNITAAVWGGTTAKVAAVASFRSIENGWHAVGPGVGCDLVGLMARGKEMRTCGVAATRAEKLWHENPLL